MSAVVASLEAIAWGRAPRYPSGRVVLPLACADGFEVSVQASAHHYAHASDGGAPYWSLEAADDKIAWPFVTFEVGYPSDPPPSETWDQYESGGVWAYVPHDVVAALLDSHGGAVSWVREATR